jgi:hypothetical protein
MIISSKGRNKGNGDTMESHTLYLSSPVKKILRLGTTKEIKVTTTVYCWTLFSSCLHKCGPFGALRDWAMKQN